MKEIIGWILCIVGAIFAFKVMNISAKNRPSEFDGRSVFEKEFEHNKQLFNVPGFKLYVFIGLGCILLGMYLIGMFG